MRHRVLGTISLLALAVLTVSCKKQDGAAAGGAMAQRPPAGVMVTAAQTRDVPVYIDEIGHCTARETVTIQPQVTGKVTQIHFIDGQDVKKGDLLFTIDPRPFEATLNQAKATLAQGQANATWTQAEFTRVQGLKNSGAVSASEFETRQNALNVAIAQVESAKAAIVKAQLDLEYCMIRAPIDGRAGQHLVDVGNVVSDSGPDGGSKMLVITRLDPIHADFTSAEHNLSAIRTAMNKGELKVQVWTPQQPEQIREGELTFLDNAVQSGAGTIRLRGTLPNQDRQFWPNQFVNVRLVLATKPKAVLVPRQAMQVGQQGPFVYVVKEDSTTELRPVTLGQPQRENTIVIEKGLNPDERVITQGQMMVMPGAKVQVIPNAPAAPATTGPAQVAEGTSSK